MLSGVSVNDVSKMTESVPGQFDVSIRKYRSGYKQSSSLWTQMLIKDAGTDEMGTKPEALKESISVNLSGALYDQDAGTDEMGTKPEALKDSISVNLSGALYDQGMHEVDVEGDNYEGHSNWIKCQKNVGHNTFIKPHEFKIEHLPQTHQDEDIHRYIELWSQLVVKVRVKDISMNRPEGYAFYNFRGKHIIVNGTGKVADITRVEDTPCICPECLHSDNPRRVWLSVWVITAMHVVFNDYEVSRTEVDLFYDHSDNRDGVKTLAGVRVIDCNLRGDWCKFECATHDLKLGQNLTNIDEQVLQLGKIIKEKEDQRFSPLAVIASHPHGWSKHITVGVWREKQLMKNTEENYDWTEYTYTTCTCYGSSGAPVWIIGPDRTHYSYNYYNHVHTSTLPCGLGKSGAGDVEKRWDEHE